MGELCAQARPKRPVVRDWGTPGALSPLVAGSDHDAVLPRRREFNLCEDAPGIACQQGKKEELFQWGRGERGGLGRNVQGKKIPSHQISFGGDFTLKAGEKNYSTAFNWSKQSATNPNSNMIAVRLGSNCLGFRWNLQAKSYRANLNFTIILSKGER